MRTQEPFGRRPEPGSAWAPREGGRRLAERLPRVGIVLDHEHRWDIDKEDRTTGWITTESRRVAGDDYGVYAKGTRYRLTLHVKAAGDGKTTVSVERTVFKRVGILWMDKDQLVQVSTARSSRRSSRRSASRCSRCTVAHSLRRKAGVSSLSPPSERAKL